MVGKGAKGGSVHIQLRSGQPGLAAFKWMMPLMVKSIRDGDSVARLQTVTIADYNTTTPLPQHIPLPPPPSPPNSPTFLEEVWGLQ